MTLNNKSRFVWYDLNSSNPEGAKEFYGAVAGWTTTPFGDTGNYDIFMNGEEGVGGVMQLPKEVAAMGVAPHWMGFVAVEDCDATAAKVTELGGKVMKEPFDAPEVGRIAIVVDPQGAALGIYTPANPGPAMSEEPTAGKVSWHELATDDWDSAFSYYSKLFGWEKTETMDIGEMGTYLMFKAPGTNNTTGGVFNRPPEMPGSAWIYYFETSDLDATIGTVKDRGGKVIHGPVEVPGGSRIAQCVDPQGAMFALHGR